MRILCSTQMLESQKSLGTYKFENPISSIQLFDNMMFHGKLRNTHVGLAVAVVVGVAAATIDYHCVLLRSEDATF